MTHPPLQTRCPHCGKLVTWDKTSPWRPFCSERCRLIDLGAWLNEHHRISRPEVEGDDHPLQEDGEFPQND